MMLHLLAGIAWDPQIRGFLAVLVGVVVLMGSVYLLLGTNLGSRLGFLVAISAIFGWCTLMGVTWWVYGTIGMLGEAPKWEVEEVVYTSGTTEDRPRRRRPREGPRPRHLRPAAARGAQRARRGRARRALERGRADPRRLAAPAGVEPELRRGQGHRRRALRRVPRRGARARGRRRLRHRRTPSSGRQGRPARRPEPPRPHHHEAQDHVLAGPAPARTTPSSRCSR